LLLLVGAGLALGLGLAAQQQTKQPETELERVARKAWQDLEEGQSETFIASAVQVRVESFLPSGEEPEARCRILLNALDSANPAVQWTTLVSLHHYGAVDTPLLRRLIGLAQDPMRRIRVAAATVIGSVREVDDEGAALLRDASGNIVAVLRANALRALARSRGGAALLPKLLVALSDEEAAVRRAAAYGIARIDMEPQPNVDAYPFVRVVEPLRVALGDEDAEVRAYAAMALGRMGSQAAPAVADLIRALADEDDGNVRSWAATALGNIGAPALRGLEAHAGDSEGGGAAGFWALKLVGEEAIPVLERLLVHERVRTSIAAARTLWDMDVDRRRMIDRMTEALAFDETKNKGLWMWDAMLAIEGLSRAGKDARTAVDALRAVAANTELDAGVRDMARDALTAIEGQ